MSPNAVSGRDLQLSTSSHLGSLRAIELTSVTSTSTSVSTRPMALTNAIQDGVAGVSSSRDEPFRLRSYQAEMVEESMRTNIIVVMDTGSGKTHM